MRVRRWLAAPVLGLAALGGILAPGVFAHGSGRGHRKLDPIKHIVVVYQENHSFDTLYGGWEHVNGLAQADAAHTKQVGQDAARTPYKCLKQNDANFTSPPLAASCTDDSTGTTFTSAFTNNPFSIDAILTPASTTCPKPGDFAANGIANGKGLPGGCTRDLVHRYYQEQYQLDGGRQDRYVTGSDAVGLTMGTYDTTKLPVYSYLHAKGHPPYAILDNFFASAFGGSFLNHQWLVAANTPEWKGADNTGGATDLHSVVDANGMPGAAPLYTPTVADPTTLKDQALTASCTPGPGRGPTPPGTVCGDFAVNTIQPKNQPYAPGTADAKRLPELTTPNIGDRLSAAKVDWAWYAGGWSNANGDVAGPGWTNGNDGKSCTDAQTAKGAVYPNCPNANFQFHHQPFNYYKAYAPGTAARVAHLKDETEFISAAKGSAKTCDLKPVSFVKPLGTENEHPGYASEATGSNHLVTLLKAIEGGACAKDTMVVVTYDEFGGSWDHVPPPGQGSAPGPHDAWGPGTRVPALVVAPRIDDRFAVDSVQHDTTSILATIEHKYGLKPLGTRDAAVADLASVFTAEGAGG